MKNILILFLAVVISGCGKGLFDQWTADSNGAILDLSSGKYGSFQMYFNLTSGAQCTATIMVTEDGTGSISGSTRTPGTGTSSDDALCTALNMTFTYEITDGVLRICSVQQPTSCSTYR